MPKVTGQNMGRRFDPTSRNGLLAAPRHCQALGAVRLTATTRVGANIVRKGKLRLGDGQPPGQGHAARQGCPRRRLDTSKRSRAWGGRGTPKLQTQTQLSDGAAGEGSKAGKREWPGTSPQGHGPAPGPLAARAGGAPIRGWPPGQVGRGLRGARGRGAECRSQRGRRSRRSLTWAARRRKAVASRASAAAAAAAMSAGSSRRRRQMFPSNAPARPGAQAPCVLRACAWGRVKGRAPAPAQSGAVRQDGGERAAGPAGRAAWDPAALYASRALLPLQDKEKKKKESILDLSKYIDKTIRVKFQGGREGETPTACTP